jgi:peptidoglycan/xylan/chitin deacetylase (PgdA/CDA1 family)
MREILFTFDTEDTISPGAVSILKTLLEQFKKYDAKGLFFITGHMAERLIDYPEVVSMLNEHEIGYHSSSHSTHPTIFEFTDVENYEEAYRVSMVRETSHINPLSGEIEGKGGLLAVRSVFPSKQVVSFRAPGFCWSPPHLEALRDLGIKFDFSTLIRRSPFRYKGLTFYPYPNLGDWENKSSYYRLLSLSMLKNKVTILDLHPSSFINKKEWDSIYWQKNPDKLIEPLLKDSSEVAALLKGFGTLLGRIKSFERIGILKMTSRLKESNEEVALTREDVVQCYTQSVRWPRRLFQFEPKYLERHFYKFFDIPFSA